MLYVNFLTFMRKTLIYIIIFVKYPPYPYKVAINQNHYYQHNNFLI